MVIKLLILVWIITNRLSGMVTVIKIHETALDSCDSQF